eukprot:COSAG02_NODE_1741_length_11107_cov_3.665425_5_plen_31_part_00
MHAHMKADIGMFLHGWKISRLNAVRIRYSD